MPGQLMLPTAPSLTKTSLSGKVPVTSNTSR